MYFSLLEERGLNTVKDNYDLWTEHDAEQEAWLRKQPVCCECKDHIQQDSAVRINGDWFCDNCLEDMREEIEE